MKSLRIATLIILPLAVSVNADILDGKGLICRKTVSDTHPWDIDTLKIFRFDGDGVIENLFIESQGRINLHRVATETIDGAKLPNSYHATLETIFIHTQGSVALDRKTLLMTIGDGKAFGKNSHQCEVVQNHEEYFEYLHDMQLEFQGAIDAIKLDRQI